MTPPAESPFASAPRGLQASATAEGFAPVDGSQSEYPEVYLDNAATTKPRPQVTQVMMRELANYGNPSSTHALGKRAKAVLEESRAEVARALGAEPDEVFFTSGGTESNNLAIRGSVLARGVESGRVITSALEHPSVTRSVRGLKREGDCKVSYVEAVHGNFDLDACERFLQEPTTLVTVMAVQNELGYRFPIPEIVELRNRYAPDALVHVDAVQAFGKIDVPVNEWGIDLASLSAHKVGGPKGIGALYVRRGTKMFTNAFGGGQEKGLRSGTEPVFLAAGFAEAVRCAFADRAAEETRVRGLWSHLRSRIAEEIPDAVVNSREDGSPYLFNFSVPGMKNVQALRWLSDHGVYVSKASACEANINTVPVGTWRHKHQLSLQAAGIPLAMGKRTLRVSFGYASTVEDADRFVDALKEYLSLH